METQSHASTHILIVEELALELALELIDSSSKSDDSKGPYPLGYIVAERLIARRRLKLAKEYYR